jgi:hypothetical protein
VLLADTQTDSAIPMAMSQAFMAGALAIRVGEPSPIARGGPMDEFCTFAVLFMIDPGMH